MSAPLTTAGQMIAGEVLRLRKKRSLMAWSLLIAVGSIVVYFGYGAIAHASDASRGPAGGPGGFRHTAGIVGVFLGPLAAVLIGAEAGAGDLAAGVFRDMALTGRQRWALFAARLPGALIVLLPITALAYGLGVAGTFVFAGGLPTPDAGTVLEGFGWVLLTDGAVCLVATGLAALLGSRPATITSLVGFELVATPLLLQSTGLGSVRSVLLDASFLHLAPIRVGASAPVPESLTVALLVLAAWLGTAVIAGAWRTIRMDA